MDGYSYDAAGNLLNDGTHQYTYDAENRLLKVDNGNTATYSYDPDGNRVQKIQSTGIYGDPAGTWQFLYDQSGRMIQRFNGTLWQGNVFVGARHLAALGGGTYFQHSDWLGTQRLQTVYQYITNPWYYNYCASLPFGDGLTCKNGRGVVGDSVVTPLHFTGKEHDFESGLDYFGARFDSSSLGRFMSPDPLGGHRVDPQTLNKYSYVRNNPLRYTDPTGLDFYLNCKQTKDNASTCQGGHVGTTTTDANGKSTFTPTVVTSASLQDPKSGNTATVTEGGVKITTASGTYTGQFINGTPAATLQGSGVLSPFTFNITGQSSGNLLRGTFQFQDRKSFV